MMKRSKVVHTPATWQLDPKSVQTSTVQYWRNGVMLTAQITKEKAQELVRDGAAFVMTGQAIGALINGEMAA